MKKIIYLFVSLYLVSYSFVNAQNYTKIKTILANVSADTVMKNLRILTGAEAVNLNGASTTITSRYRFMAGNSNAALYIKNKLSNYPSITVAEQAITGGGKNIIATQLGKTTPNSQIVICAHYDSFLNSDPSPGADDDGSGTVAVLEAARLLSQYGTDYTVVYALFDREEDDLNGSEYYAALAQTNSTSILAVVNLDMIGWDKNGFSDFEVIKREVSTSAALATRVSDANTQCLIAANITTTTNVSTRDADNVSFWNHGFPAVLIIELYGMENPYMHKATDVVANINSAFLTKGVKLGIASAASYLSLDDSPLPVELIDFTATPTNNKIELKWKTATEVNNYGFNVEMRHVSSLQGTSASLSASWETLGFVQGHGNSNSPKNYSFVDANPVTGKVQYRLKQIDFDGKYEYSGVIEVNVAAQTNFSIKQNFPNPFNPSTTIQYVIPSVAKESTEIASSQQSGTRNDNVHVTLKVYDILGRVVATLVDGYKPAGSYVETFSGISLPSGMYFYKLTAGNFSETKKMLLMK